MYKLSFATPWKRSWLIAHPGECIRTFAALEVRRRWTDNHSRNTYDLDLWHYALECCINIALCAPCTCFDQFRSSCVFFFRKLWHISCISVVWLYGLDFWPFNRESSRYVTLPSTNHQLWRLYPFISYGTFCVWVLWGYDLDMTFDFKIPSYVWYASAVSNWAFCVI